MPHHQVCSVSCERKCKSIVGLSKIQILNIQHTEHIYNHIVYFTQDSTQELNSQLFVLCGCCKLRYCSRQCLGQASISVCFTIKKIPALRCCVVRISSLLYCRPTLNAKQFGYGVIHRWIVTQVSPLIVGSWYPY